MNVLLKVILTALAEVASDPALGYRGASISSALRLAAVALDKGEEGVKKLKELAETVKTYNVNTKKELLTKLKERSDAAHNILNPPAEKEDEE